VSDSELYRRVAERMRAGEHYYPAMTAEIEALGYPFAGSAFNWRLPTLSWFESALPAGANPVVLTSLGAITIGLWFTFFLRRGLGAALGAGVLLLAMLPLWMHDGTSRLHDLWAGQLIAASLGSWALGFRGASVAFGAIALGIRELALAYVLVMAALAVYERRRREAAAWGLVVVAFGIGLALHVVAASREITADAVAPNWLALGGWCFVLSAARTYILVFSTPTWLNALLVPAAVAGLTQWTGPAGRRVGATVAAYLVAFMVGGLPVNWYWGFLIAPILPLGLLGWRAPNATPEPAGAGQDASPKAE
jgi:hypothetical protein